jgi:hypothetical protein
MALASEVSGPLAPCLLIEVRQTLASIIVMTSVSNRLNALRAPIPGTFDSRSPSAIYCCDHHDAWRTRRMRWLNVWKSETHCRARAVSQSLEWPNASSDLCLCSYRTRALLTGSCLMSGPEPGFSAPATTSIRNRNTIAKTANPARVGRCSADGV